MIFDTHAHLQDERYDEDREQIIANLEAEGVCGAVMIGSSMESSRAALALAQTYPNLYAAVGVHPHHAQEFQTDDLASLLCLLAKPEVIAMGEIGLDFYYDHSPRDKQKEVFLAQLELAAELHMPTIYHVRDAHGEMLALLRERKGNLPPSVLHCCSASWESAQEYLDMGFYVSFAGSVTFKNAKNIVEVARRMPLDRLLIETDCPYLSPEPYRGKRNQPAYALHTARRVAQIREMDFEELCEKSNQNAKEFFGIQ